jgi:hypothetical protein
MFRGALSGGPYPAKAATRVPRNNQRLQNHLDVGRHRCPGRPCTARRRRRREHLLRRPRQEFYSISGGRAFDSTQQGWAESVEGRFNRPVSVYRQGDMPIQRCGQSASAACGKAGARLNAHTELRAKRQRSAREAIYRDRPVVEILSGLTSRSIRMVVFSSSLHSWYALAHV